MKKMIFWSVLLAIVLPFASCKKEMMEYEGMEGVYFGVRSGPTWAAPASWPFRPYTNVEFVKQPEAVQELQLSIAVNITGPVKDYDRPFKVVVNPDSTTAVAGVHYLPFGDTYNIPANAITGYIPITVKRTPEMLNKNIRLGLRLVANEHFGLSFPEWKAIPGLGETTIGNDTAFDASLHVININDLMVQPAVWRGSVQDGNREAGVWGAFTRKKMELMCQLFDLKYEDFASEVTMTPVLVILISNELGRYLINQFNAGTPVLEDDGRLMFAGSVPWTSYIGVPYHP
ncbi:DUF4843 domain-containing protein [Pseudobacter ginsenosidimutans]|uniref:Uncharacterized protein DUF4843 n=1 Tax=Pseudobacter ginsenosidimutans TaxID=661488 RepID=A0A4Q7N547_9BACT|nr:DUF4843 domain-containing protein [Pseudobacter ginsenosidimutans]QEC44675.1 DUF4843 domain-containing protein [Pseudobacter ginsenosidimutans]RZS76156.1 uncharacterized protein DUF4843 [Pseudobacter ginsenosidimutans]